MMNYFRRLLGRPTRVTYACTPGPLALGHVTILPPDNVVPGQQSTGFGTRVYLDGTELKNVMSVRLDISCEAITTATLTLAA